MIKDIFYLLNGKKLLKLLQEEMKILIELAKILLILWILLIKIKKFWIKEKNNQIHKKDSIDKMKRKTSQEIEKLVIEKINLKDQNFKELLIYKLKFKF